MTYPEGTRVTARGQMGTVDSFVTSAYVHGEIIGYNVLWDDGSWTFEILDAIDEVENPLAVHFGDVMGQVEKLTIKGDE